MADNASTPNRVHFSSAGAVRRVSPFAHRAHELSPVTIAHGGLVAAISTNTPHRIIGNADRFDVLERRDHLRSILAAVTAYAKVIVTDTRDAATVTIHDETGYLEDAASDICAAFTSAVDRMMDGEAA
jgi:hypothetical protein